MPRGGASKSFERGKWTCFRSRQGRALHRNVDIWVGACVAQQQHRHNQPRTDDQTCFKTHRLFFMLPGINESSCCRVLGLGVCLSSCSCLSDDDKARLLTTNQIRHSQGYVISMRRLLTTNQIRLSQGYVISMRRLLTTNQVRHSQGYVISMRRLLTTNQIRHSQGYVSMRRLLTTNQIRHSQGYVTSMRRLLTTNQIRHSQGYVTSMRQTFSQP